MGISLNPLMRNAVILALSDVGDGLAACALLLHAHEPSLVTDTPPSCVRLGCAHLCPVAVPRSQLGHARRLPPLVFAVYARTTYRYYARLRTVLLPFRVVRNRECAPCRVCVVRCVPTGVPININLK